MDERTGESLLRDVERALRGQPAESLIGLYKTELIRRRGPWKGLDDFEVATLE